MMNSSEYERLPKRIQSIYDTCSVEEQQYLIQILQELSDTGTSPTYDTLWLQDYKELPVDLDTFLCDDRYLGLTNREGQAIYPYWKQSMHDIFDAGNQYTQCVFTGATRIGKTSTAITCAAYMLYRMMCLRDPQKFFQKKEISQFSVLFFNLTLDLAKSVAFREFNDTLKMSPWFNDHGTFSKSERNFYYIPEGGKIVVEAGSDVAHSLGKQVFCLSGDTEIISSDGNCYKLSEVEDKYVDLIQYDIHDGKFCTGRGYCKRTGYANDTIRITLENGSVIEGTSDHLVLLSDGTYKKLGDLTESDDILDSPYIDAEVDEMNFNRDIESVKFTVYCHTSPKGKRYIGITSRPVKDRWLEGGKGYRDNHHLWSAIQLYGWENFRHDIIAEGLNLEEASQLESHLIATYNTMNPEFGYNQTSGGNWSRPSESTRRRISEGLRNRGPEVNAKISSSLKGHSVSEETRKKISDANSGNHRCGRGRRSEEGKQKLIENLRGRVPWNKGLSKYTDERIASYSEKQKGKFVSESTRKKISDSRKAKINSGYSPIWVHNDEEERLIQIDQLVEYVDKGYASGRLNRLDIYINKDGNCIKINHNELDTYIQQGWKQGKTSQISENIKKSRQQYVWTFENLEFSTSEELAEYLRIHTEYRNIVGSTITSLYRKGFNQSKIYHGLEGKITRKSVIHENI